MEVELKMRLADDALDAVRDRLQKMGADGVVTTQDDTFFSHPCRDLPGSDEAFRLRREGDRLELTHKGPREPGDLKARPEENLVVADDPVPLLYALGFRPVARLHKRREAWRVDHAEVALDHVEGLGWFIEIEAKGHDRPREHVEALRQALGLDGEPVAESYLELALAADTDAATLL